MTGTSSSRILAPVLVLGAALFVRFGLMFGKGGGWGYAVDYDEGVYFSAASLVWNGTFPYRDFVFVHPPGLLAWLLLPAGLGKLVLGPAAAFVVARWMAALAGTLSCFLVYRLAEKRAGVVGGLAAGVSLALYPEVVGVDRGVFLEPVLNLCCLTLAFCVQRATLGLTPEKKWLAFAGLAAGAAVSVKLWAGIWLLAALVPVLRAAGVMGAIRFLVPAAFAAAALMLPAVLQAPPAFIEQTLTFHTLRPPDGIPDRLERIGQLFNWRHAGTDLLAVLGLLFVLLRKELRKSSLFFALVYLATLAAFMANTTYWEQYNAHLAPSAAVLAGLGAGTLWRLLGARPAALRAVVALALASLSIFSIAHTRKTFGRTRLWVDLGDVVRDAKVKTPCAMEPSFLLAADLLPPRIGTAGHFVDTYALGLLEAGRSGKKFDSAGAAFDDAASQAGYAQAVERCDLMVMGDRGRMQLAGPLEDRVLGWKKLGDTQPDVYRRSP